MVEIIGLRSVVDNDDASMTNRRLIADRARCHRAVMAVSSA
jgi:hypothetical protein